MYLNCYYRLDCDLSQPSAILKMCSSMTSVDDMNYDRVLIKISLLLQGLPFEKLKGLDSENKLSFTLCCYLIAAFRKTTVEFSTDFIKTYHEYNIDSFQFMRMVKIFLKSSIKERLYIDTSLEELCIAAFERRKVFINELLNLNVIKPQMAIMDYFTSDGIKRILSKEIMNIVDALVEEALKSISSTVKAGINVGMAVGIVIYAYQIFTNDDSTMMDMIGAVLAMLIQCAINPLVQDVIGVVFASIDKLSPQMDFFSMGVPDVGPLIAGLSLFPIFSTLQKEGKCADKVKMLIKDLAALGNSKKGITELCIAVCDTLRKCGRIAATYLGIPVPVSESSGSSDLDAFFHQFEQLLSKERSDGLVLSLENLWNIQDLIIKGNRLLNTAINNPIHKFYCNLIISRMKALTDLESAFVKANVSETGLRFETIGAMFFGTPGSNKSFVVKRAADDAVAIDSNEEEMRMHLENDRTFIFNRQFENRYWDGFTPRHKVILTDDYGQSVGVADGDGESMQSIRMLNSFPHDLHTAAMSGKGVLRNNTKFAFATTNLTKLNPDDIVSPQALQRRWLCYWVSLKPEYLKKSNGKVSLRHQVKNPAKFVGADGLAIELSTDMFCFYKYDPMKGEILTKESYSYDQLMSSLKDLYKLRYSHYEMNQKVYKQSSLAFYKNLTESGFHDEINEIKARMVQNAQTFNENYDTWRNRDTEELKPQMGDLLNNWWSTTHKPSKDYYHSIPPTWYTEDLGTFSECMCIDMEKSTLFFRYHMFETWLIPEDKDVEFKKMLDDMLERTPMCAARAIIEYCYVKNLDLHTALKSHLSVTDPVTFKMVMNGQRSPYGFLPPRVVLKYDKDLFENTEEMFNKAKVFIHTKWISTLQFAYMAKHALDDVIRAHPILKTIAMVVALGSIVYSLKKLVGNNKPISADPQHVYEHIPTKVKSKGKAIKSLKDMGIKPQLDEVSLAMARKIDGTNMIEMGIDDPSKPESFTLLGSLLMLKGRIGVCNLHYVSYFSTYHQTRGDLNLLFRSKGILFAKMPISEFLSLFKSENQLNCDEDLAFFHMPRTFRVFSDITEKFVRTDFILTKSKLDLLCKLPSQDVYVCTSSILTTQVILSLPLPSGQESEVSRSLCYNLPTKPGDCGTPLYYVDPLSGNRKITGIHCAGQGSKGYGTLLTYEDVQRHVGYLVEANGMQILPTEEHIITDDVIVPQLLTKFLVESQVDMKHNILGSHDKVTSPFRGKPGWEKTEDLSALNCVDGVSPLSKALDHFSKGPVDISVLPEIQKIAFDRSIDDYSYLILAIPRYKDMSLPTLEQSIWGDGELNMVNPLKSQSSAGCLLKKEFHILKTRLFAGTRDNTNPFFHFIEKRYARYMSYFDRGIRIPDVYSFNLKSETLPCEKVKELKTRGYFGAGFDTMYLYNMYFGKFATAYLKNIFNNETSLGINPCSAQWMELIERLRKFDSSVNPEVGDSDYSKFDTCHFKDLLWSVLDIINLWYDNADGCNDVRIWLWHELVFPRILIGDMVFTLQRGMVSGNFLTIIINCMVNSILFRYSFFRIAQENELAIVSFTSVVSLNVTGDDNIYSVHPEWRSFIHPLSLASYVAELGFSMTAADKASEITDKHKNLSLCLYLKRGFDVSRNNPVGLPLAPLKFDVINNIPQWTQRKDFDLSIFIGNVNSSLREAALHGQNKYNVFLKLVITTMASVKPDLLPLVQAKAWEEQLVDIYG